MVHKTTKQVLGVPQEEASGARPSSWLLAARQALTLGIAVAALGLSACSKDDNRPAPQPQPAPSTESEYSNPHEGNKVTINFGLSVGVDSKDLKAMGMLRGEPRALTLNNQGNIIDNPTATDTWTIRIFFRKKYPDAAGQTILGWSDVKFTYDGDLIDPITNKRTIKLKHDSAPITLNDVPADTKFYPEETEKGIWQICGFAGGAQWGKNADGTENHRRISYMYDPSIDDILEPDQVRAPLIFPWTTYKSSSLEEIPSIKLIPFGCIIRLKLGHILEGTETFKAKRIHIISNAFSNQGFFDFIGSNGSTGSSWTSSTNSVRQYNSATSNTFVGNLMPTGHYPIYNLATVSPVTNGLIKYAENYANYPSPQINHYLQKMTFNPRQGHDEIHPFIADNEILIWAAPSSNLTGFSSSDMITTRVFVEEAGTYSAGTAADAAKHTHVYFTDYVPGSFSFGARNEPMHGRYYGLTAHVNLPVRLPIEYVADYNLAGGTNTASGKNLQPINVSNRTYGENGAELRMANRDKDTPQASLNPNDPHRNDQSGYYPFQMVRSFVSSSPMNPGNKTFSEFDMIDSDGQRIYFADKYFIPEPDNFFALFPGGELRTSTNFFLASSAQRNKIDCVQIGEAPYDHTTGNLRDGTLCLAFNSSYSASYGSRPTTPGLSRTVYAIRFMSRMALSDYILNQPGFSSMTNSNYNRYFNWDTNLFACVYRYRRLGPMSAENQTDRIQIDVVYLGESATNPSIFTQIQQESWWTAQAAKAITKVLPAVTMRYGSSYYRTLGTESLYLTPRVGVKIPDSSSPSLEKSFVVSYTNANGALNVYYSWDDSRYPIRPFYEKPPRTPNF